MNIVHKIFLIQLYVHVREVSDLFNDGFSDGFSDGFAAAPQNDP